MSFLLSGTAFHQARQTCWAIIRSQEIETKYWQKILKRFQNPSKIPLRRTIYGLPKFYQNENKTNHRNQNHQRQNYIKWRAIKCIKRISFCNWIIFFGQILCWRRKKSLQAVNTQCEKLATKQVKIEDSYNDDIKTMNAFRCSN